ncbi:unnamed protein product [Phytomonas sp. Hart1]|nr:unnamed protein product [Phytomonas sp. Hart1]|eukprot:CCW70264.1 unnamed protein product [Phytomonas sp. isolate Hart1]
MSERHITQNSTGGLQTDAVFIPNDSKVSFAGRLGITANQVSVYKSSAQSGRDLMFIGSCTVRHLQFYRHQDLIILVGDSRRLFDIVASSDELAAHLSLSIYDNIIANCAKWSTLTVQLNLPEVCDVVVSALESRRATQLPAPPFPLHHLAVLPDTPVNRELPDRDHRQRPLELPQSKSKSRPGYLESKSQSRRGYTESKSQSRPGYVQSKSETNSCFSHSRSRDRGRKADSAPRQLRGVRGSEGYREAAAAVEEPDVYVEEAGMAAEREGERGGWNRPAAPRAGPGEVEGLLRRVQRYQHHRLHVMQYLHRAMVQQAFIAEEAKLRAGRPRRVSPPHCSSSPATGEGEGRLREIEARLAAVEELHRAAEREHAEAAELRMEYEARLAALAPNGRPDGASREVSLGDVLDGPNEATTVLDRHVVGEEWWLLYPQYQHELQFNAQIDLCLALKLPRTAVCVVELSLDEGGLRLQLRIHHDRAGLPRSEIEWRVRSCPFRMLRRMYEMRRLYEGRRRKVEPVVGTRPRMIADVGVVPALAPNAVGTWRSSSQGDSHCVSGSTLFPPSGSLALPQPRSRTTYRGDDDCCEDFSSFVERDVVSLEGSLLPRRFTIPQEETSQGPLEKTRQQINAELWLHVCEQAEHLVEDEAYSRADLLLQEAKQRRTISQFHQREAATTSFAFLQSERIERASLEVSAARQVQVLMVAHRRQLALFRVVDAERKRRGEIAEREKDEWCALNMTMKPSSTHIHAAALLDAERNAQTSSIASTSAKALNDVIAVEKVARAVIMSDAMSEFLELFCESFSPSEGGRGGVLSSSLTEAGYYPARIPTMLSELVQDERTLRDINAVEERRRRVLYAHGEIEQRESVCRDLVEQRELEKRGEVLDAAVRERRQLHERRLKDREHLSHLLTEEHFYRKALLSDARDELEAISERFAAAWRYLLAPAAAEEGIEGEDLTPRRHFAGAARTAKPFHYMTFSPEDMDYAPSAQLAVEGILGCAVNKNLEVTRVQRPLSQQCNAEEEQFQAGDMILDVSGQSLHSLSHLREVLSNRCVQIQMETRLKFPEVPDDHLTINPALQKYLKLLCEHHNFLVLVLRGCDIFQVIVGT